MVSCACAIAPDASAQHAAATQSLQLTSAGGLVTAGYSGASSTNMIAGNQLVVYALINPCKPPRQILMAWSDGTSEYRASWGEDLIETMTAHTRIGVVPTGGSWVRLETLASSIGAAGKAIRGLTIKMYDGEAWFDHIGTSACVVTTAPAPASRADENVWFDDAFPAGAVVGTGGNNRPWVWDTTQAASGTQSHTDTLEAGWKQHAFSGAAVHVRDEDLLRRIARIDERPGEEDVARNNVELLRRAAERMLLPARFERIGVRLRSAARRRSSTLLWATSSSPGRSSIRAIRRSRSSSRT